MSVPRIITCPDCLREQSLAPAGEPGGITIAEAESLGWIPLDAAAAVDLAATIANECLPATEEIERVPMRCPFCETDRIAQN